MGVEQEMSSSDTLDRSNISSLRTDNTPTTESPNKNANLEQNKHCFCQRQAPEIVKLVSCPVLDSNYIPSPHQRDCHCQNFKLNAYDTRKQSVPADWENFNWKWPRQSYSSNKKDKSKNKRFSHADKPYACCDTFEGIPRRKSFNGRSVVENPMRRLNMRDKTDNSEKIEIYYFDHGNSAYYHTTDVAPILLTEKFAEKSNSAATKFWAEIFGYVHIGASFLTAFVLQLLRCVLFSIVRPLTVGVVQLIADYFIKPVLSILFNGIIQPILILCYNIATSLRDCCEPLAAALGFFVREVAVLFRACRLIEINNHKHVINDDNT